MPEPIALPTEVSLTVYSVVWPATEALMRQCLVEEADALLSRHRCAFTKRQDGLNAPFFVAWKSFAASAVEGLDQFEQSYPTAGSSEAIREIIRTCVSRQQVLVVFDGDYEGYEALASHQGTRVVRVERRAWRETLENWRIHGAPFGPGGAQWWISQPSAIDGNVWPEFSEWLDAAATLEGCQVWVDLCYVGSATQSAPIRLPQHSALAGVVFSLSKVMGAYYRRIGGCLSREEIPGLWGNRWFKNLDSLYLGQRWLEQAKSAADTALAARAYQSQAFSRAMDVLGGSDLWSRSGIIWRPSDVPLLMHALPVGTPPSGWEHVWMAALRGKDAPASVRLCLTPSIEQIIQEDFHVA